MWAPGLGEALLPPTGMQHNQKATISTDSDISTFVTTAPWSSTGSKCTGLSLTTMVDTDEPEISQSMHVGMLLRCFLCHETLPQPG